MNPYLNETLGEVSKPLEEWLDVHMRNNPGNHKGFVTLVATDHFEVWCQKCLQRRNHEQGTL